MIFILAFSLFTFRNSMLFIQGVFLTAKHLAAVPVSVTKKGCGWPLGSFLFGTEMGGGAVKNDPVQSKLCEFRL